MAKIKIHPTDPTCHMYWDIARNEPNYFWVRPTNPSWNWNGDFDKPTVSPSILTRFGDYIDHVFIRNGQIQYLSDCTHKYAGKVVDMVDFPEDW